MVRCEDLKKTGSDRVTVFKVWPFPRDVFFERF